MSDRLTTRVGGSMLKNPLIVAAAKHLIDAERVRRALAAGVGAVVVKSANESQAANYQS
jgi:dihydroorotate dehydrogenase (NAD+) catalytic subunit